MITSPKGKEMLSYISPLYQNSKIEQAIYEAIGSEWDSADELANEILLQLHPQTATWGLVFWEQRLGLPTNTNEDIERRSRKVIAKRQSKHIINPERMAIILKNYTGADIEIIENIAPYTFEVKLTGREGFPKSLEDLYKEVKRIKPSHLSVRYKLISITESELFIGACTFCGEQIIVYPWSPKKIESKGKINIAMANNTGIENITLYPKKEG
ncbi:YmfQ family protein [Clostridium sporogenes]|uniref:YmfQ family protein n=1 Tax=Clostridium sporogenes TaxID=1509 RepID=UPI002238DEE6|nr:YmfQ family protein [Clostridium sporogenes]MCW6088808.1 YmfQ family protein [Clostridium sporogenes]